MRFDRWRFAIPFAVAMAIAVNQAPKAKGSEPIQVLTAPNPIVVLEPNREPSGLRAPLGAENPSLIPQDVIIDAAATSGDRTYYRAYYPATREYRVLGTIQTTQGTALKELNKPSISSTYLNSFDGIAAAQENQDIVIGVGSNFSSIRSVFFFSKNGGQSWEYIYSLSPFAGVQLSTDGRFAYTRPGMFLTDQYSIQRINLETGNTDKSYEIRDLGERFDLDRLTQPQKQQDGSYKTYAVTRLGWAELTFKPDAENQPDFSSEEVKPEYVDALSYSKSIHELTTKKDTLWLVNNYVITKAGSNSRFPNFVTVGSIVEYTSRKAVMLIQPDLRLYASSPEIKSQGNYITIQDLILDEMANQAFIITNLNGLKNEIEVFSLNGNNRELIQKSGDFPASGVIYKLNVFTRNGKRILQAFVNSKESGKTGIYEKEITTGINKSPWEKGITYTQRVRLPQTGN